MVELKMQTDKVKLNGSLVLLLNVVKKSENYREVDLYSPYLIHNETNYLMKFREVGIA